MQRAGLDRLDDVVIEAGLVRAAAILVLAPAGQGDDGGPLQAGLAAEPAADLVAVHAGHADIEQDELGAEVDRLAQGGRPVVGHADLLPGQLQQHAQAHGRVNVVVHDQYAVAS